MRRPRHVTQTVAALAVMVLAAAPVGAQMISFDDGTYLVDKDIAAGVYHAPGGEFCYWERLSGLSGDFEDILANGAGERRIIIEIRESDVAFKSSGCGTWRHRLAALSGRVSVPVAALDASIRAMLVAVVVAVDDPDILDKVVEYARMAAQDEEVADDDRWIVDNFMNLLEEAAKIVRESAAG